MITTVYENESSHINLKINNSKSAAVKNGKWKNPGATFYDQLMNSSYFPNNNPDDKDNLYYTDYLKEAYLIAPVKDIKNSPHGRTPYARSGCKYPHHVIKDDELVLSVPGVKAAYARACQQHVFSGSVKSHLEKHITELGLKAEFHHGNLYWNEDVDNWNKINDNFSSIENYISEGLDIDLSSDDGILFDEGIKEFGNKIIKGLRKIIEWIFRFFRNKNTLYNVQSLGSYRIMNLKVPLHMVGLPYVLTSYKSTVNESGIIFNEELNITNSWLNHLGTGQTSVNEEELSIAMEKFGKRYDINVVYMEANHIAFAMKTYRNFLMKHKDTDVFICHETDENRPVICIGKRFFNQNRFHDTRMSVEDIIMLMAHEYGHCLVYNNYTSLDIVKSKITLFLLMSVQNKFEDIPKSYFGMAYYHSLLEKAANDAVGIISPQDILKLYKAPGGSYIGWENSIYGKIIQVFIPNQLAIITITTPSEISIDDVRYCIQFNKEMYSNIFSNYPEERDKVIKSLNNLDAEDVLSTIQGKKDGYDDMRDRYESVNFNEEKSNNELIQEINESSKWFDDFLYNYNEEGEDLPPSLEDEPQQSLPKQTDSAETDKNGIRRKKLYIAFIEWCKESNPKNTFGSVFDKEAFHSTYPFVPDEMRYFYRLANPMLCVLSGNLTFFALAELRKLNMKNSRLNEMMIFAATDTDLRVFNKSDKKVYRGTEENGMLKLNETLGDTFDTYIQNMINQGDILNAPMEPELSIEQ
jgi:hypothetical protein